MAGNMGRYLMKTPARGVRDVTCSDGFIRLIEIEETGMVDAARASNGSRNKAMRTPTTESYKPGGWNAVIWKRASSSKKWIKDCTAYVSKGSIWPVLIIRKPFGGWSCLEYAGRRYFLSDGQNRFEGQKRMGTQD